MRYEDRAVQDKELPPPTMRELAVILFRQWKVFVTVAGLVLVLAVIYAFAGVA